MRGDTENIFIILIGNMYSMGSLKAEWQLKTLSSSRQRTYFYGDINNSLSKKQPLLKLR